MCRNYYCPTTVTNITTNQLGSLWTSGLLKLSMFTGNSADDTSNMYVTGRNKDSGTRVAAAADALYTGARIKYWGFNTTAPTTWALMSENLNGNDLRHRIQLRWQRGDCLDQPERHRQQRRCGLASVIWDSTTP
jgi:hypothetical protein